MDDMDVLAVTAAFLLGIPFAYLYAGWVAIDE